MEKILKVDMGERSVRVEELPEGLRRLGGRGFTSSVVSAETPPGCDPFSSENVLVIACGLLAGTAASTAGRLSVGTKSPLTGGIKESNAGGTAGHAMGRLGVRGIVVRGAAREGTWVLVIDRDGARLERRDDLRLAESYAAVAALRSSYGGDASVILVGPAGERRLKAASVIVTDPEGRPTRHCGRGGTGAVMGSKGLKAVVLDTRGTRPPAPADRGAFAMHAKRFVEALRAHPVTGEALPAYGTNVLANIINEAGAYPTRCFSSGRFEGTEKVSGETMRDVIIERGGSPTHVCQPGCVIRCSNVYLGPDGGHLASGLEYESIWANGANCGIDDLDVIARLDRLYDELGIDSIETGVAIGVAMQAGVIPFGDGEGALRLAGEIAAGTPLGTALGNGAAAAGARLGCARVPVVKGQALPAYDPRAIKGMGVTYATSTMGADHTAGYAVATSILNCGGSLDPLATEGQAALSKRLQAATAALDSIGVCLFVAFPVLDDPAALESLLGMVNARHGWGMTAADLPAMGEEILRIERRFNAAAGLTAADDRLPAFFLTEPLEPHRHVFDIPERELDEVCGRPPEGAERP
ncbi:MAG: aldehyde ferredoxin oxidoreductase C-terminal domain-containing protein [bacterium]|nr:aldehyde ferredoxin oxidoreductase C-terminal domain-containing protein [bacterium]